jgi:DNA topoisomerase IA
LRGVGNSRQRAATNKILLLSNGAGDEAQLLPALRSGETAPLQNPTIEDKETRPPARYNEGTLIEAMQMPGALLMMRLCGNG